MAIRKNYKTGSKFLYGKVGSVSYSKDTTGLAVLYLIEKDDADANVENLITKMSIIVDPADPDFTPEEMDKPNSNIIKQVYKNIKKKTEIFEGYTDV